MKFKINVVYGNKNILSRFANKQFICGCNQITVCMQLPTVLSWCETGVKRDIDKYF